MSVFFKSQIPGLHHFSWQPILVLLRLKCHSTHSFCLPASKKLRQEGQCLHPILFYCCSHMSKSPTKSGSRGHQETKRFKPVVRLNTLVASIAWSISFSSWPVMIPFSEVQQKQGKHFHLKMHSGTAGIVSPSPTFE
jgi:hypothetical protein